MNNKLISIIIPIYNAQDKIEKCINSLLKQNYKNFELILINDGSTDDSELICKKYSNNDKRVIYIKKDNGGVSSARNRGLEAAKGEYISFVDADDYIEENMYEKMIEAALYNNADLVICNYKREDEKGKVIKKSALSTKLKKIKIFNKKEFIKYAYKYSSIDLFVWNKLYSRKLIYKLSETIKFNEQIDMSEDALFNAEIINKNDKVSCIYIPNILYNYIINKSSITNQRINNKKLTYLNEKIKEIEILSQNNIDTNISKTLYMIFFNTNNKQYNDEINIKYKEYYNQYKKEINFLKLPLRIKIKYILSMK